MANIFREKKKPHTQCIKHSEGLPICPTICVGRSATLPEPLLNWAPHAWCWTKVLIVRLETSAAICNSAQKGTTLKNNTYPPDQSVWKTWWHAVWPRNTRHALQLGLGDTDNGKLLGYKVAPQPPAPPQPKLFLKIHEVRHPFQNHLFIF